MAGVGGSKHRLVDEPEEVVELSSSSSLVVGEIPLCPQPLATIYPEGFDFVGASSRASKESNAEVSGGHSEGSDEEYGASEGGFGDEGDEGGAGFDYEAGEEPAAGGDEDSAAVVEDEADLAPYGDRLARKDCNTYSSLTTRRLG